MILSWDRCSGEKSLKKDGETQLGYQSFASWFTASAPLEWLSPACVERLPQHAHSSSLQQRSDPLRHTLEKVSRVTLLLSIHVLLGSLDVLLNSHSALFWRNLRRKGTQQQADLKREHFTQARPPSPENSPLCPYDEPDGSGCWELMSVWQKQEEREGIRGLLGKGGVIIMKPCPVPERKAAFPCPPGVLVNLINRFHSWMSFSVSSRHK